MNKLELKIPPVALVLLFALAMWLVANYAPVFAFVFPWRMIAAIALATAGALFGLAGVVAFRRARTTVDPMHPHAASALVTTGVYRLTRNPMYVGLLLLLAAWAAWLAHALALLLLPGFVATMNRLQIRPEERILSEKFGTAFEAYRQAVRRWI